MDNLPALSSRATPKSICQNTIAQQSRLGRTGEPLRTLPAMNVCPSSHVEIDESNRHARSENGVSGPRVFLNVELSLGRHVARHAKRPAHDDYL